MFFFAPALQASVDARVALERDLRQAIRENQFSLYYQPQLDRGLLTGAEALIRWNHPHAGSSHAAGVCAARRGNRTDLPHGNWVLRRPACSLRLGGT